METNKVFYLTVLGLILLVGNCQGAEPKVTCAYYGQFISDPYDCKSYYYCTETLYPEHRTCPDDSYWDSVAMNCYPLPVTCAGSPVPACSYANQRLPDPYDCTAYYICASDLSPVHVYCDPGFSFSIYSLTCIYPYDPAQCQNIIITTSVYPVDCAFASQVLPDPYDCSVFYVCDYNLYPQYHRCSSSLWYDPAYASCNIAGRVLCNGGYRPQPIPSALPSTGGVVGPLPICARPSELHGNYYDCNQFWKCNQQNYPEPFKCPVDLLFDYVTTNCEIPSLANCLVRKDSEEK